MTGQIKNNLKEKGYGFIVSDENGKEYFFHNSCCIDSFSSLTPGRKVQFDIVISPKGPRAEDVRLI